MIPSSYDRLPQASQSDGELLQLFPFFTYYSFQYQISPEQLPFFFGISTLRVNSYTFLLKNYEDRIRKLIFVIMSILQMY